MNLNNSLDDRHFDADTRRCSESERRLLNAARVGAFAELCSLLEKGVALCTADRNGKTALHRAVRGGHAKLVRHLCSQGADMEACDYFNRSALFYCLDAAMTQLLLQLGANPHAADGYGRTPLFYSRNAAQARVLLLHGASVSARDKGGQTPLHSFVCRQNAERVCLLLRRRADVNAADDAGRTPLHLAVSRNDEDMVLLLLELGASVNAADNAGHTPLHLAVAAQSEGMARLLLGRGAAVCAANAAGDTPLHEAAARGDAGLVRLLLDHGADVRAANRCGTTILHLALARQLPESLLGEILAGGADVNAVDSHGDCPLHCCLNEEVMRYLLLHGAEPNVQSRGEKTPLYHAVAHGYSLGLLQLLLERGASVNLPSYQRRRPLHACREAAAARLLLQHGADVNARDYIGCNALFCCRFGEVARELLLAGSELTEKWDYDGKTLLHRAIRYDFPVDVVALLLERGQDVNAVDKRGRSPLGYLLDLETRRWELFSAVRHSLDSRKTVELARLLCRHGARLNAEDDAAPGEVLLALEDDFSADELEQVRQLLCGEG